MKKGRFSEVQMIGVLREQEAGAATEDACRCPISSGRKPPRPDRIASLRDWPQLQALPLRLPRQDLSRSPQGRVPVHACDKSRIVQSL